jgi:hypothetical protein
MRPVNSPRDRQWVLAVVLACAAVTASAGQAPTLQVSPGRLTFIGTEGTGTLGAQRVEVTVGGTAETWRARGSAPWIVVSPERGQGPGVLSVRVVSRALAAGAHRGSVVIEATGATGSPASVAVLVSIVKPRPKPQPAQPAATPEQPTGAAATPATQKPATAAPAAGALPSAGPVKASVPEVRFSAPLGLADKLVFPIKLAADGNAAIRWNATTDQRWVTATPTQGVTPAEITVSAVPGALAAGTYSATLAIHVSGQTSAIRLPIRLAVQGAGGPLAFFSPRLPSAGMNVPYSAPVPVRGGRPPYTFQVAQGQLPPDLGLMNGTLTGIPRTPGTFAFSIAVTDSSDPPVTAFQTFMFAVSVIDQNTGLVVQPTQLAFTATGARSPAPVTMTIASGGPPLTWRVASDAAWLKIQPASGVAPASLSVGVDVESLMPGAYAATITVTMDAAPNSPISVPVRLTVK